MGSLLEAPPQAETDDLSMFGEVPGDTQQIGDLYFRKVIRDFADNARIKKRDLPADQEIAVQIPDEQSQTIHVVPLDDLTLSRDPNNRNFFANFKKVVKDELGEHTVRDVTVAISIGAAAVVAGSFVRRKKAK